MAKIAYIDKRFSKKSLLVIERSNEILEELSAQGFTLTLRQLFYQHVRRDWIPNTQKSYDNLGNTISEARLCGLVDWNHMEDRIRDLAALPHWSDPSDVINSAAEGYHIDMWAAQKYRPEVWIEKDALSGIVEGVCRKLDVPYFCCRGYTSQSSMWGGAMRLKKWARAGQIPYIFHFGDHDPSGKDMTRDIMDRLKMFMGPVKLERLALNMDQIKQYNPPPNPAKVSDSRYQAYMEEFGEDSWELDALEPKQIVELIESNIKKLIEPKAWKKDEKRFEADQTLLRKCSSRWDDVRDFLEDLEDEE